MFKCATIVLSVSGLAAAAHAQEQFSLTLIPSETVLECVGPVSFTLTVYGDSTFGTHILGGAFSLSSGSSGGFQISDMSWSPADWAAFNSDDGYAGGGEYNRVIFGQIVIPGVPPFDQPAPGSELGQALGSFTVTINEPHPELIDFELVVDDPFAMEVIDIDTGVVMNDTQGELTLHGATVLVCPSPSGCALLGLAGLGAARRRRTS